MGKKGRRERHNISLKEEGGRTYLADQIMSCRCWLSVRSEGGHAVNDVIDYISIHMITLSGSVFLFSLEKLLWTKHETNLFIYLFCRTVNVRIQF